MRFIGYAGDCVIEADLDVPSGARLSDLLNEASALALRNAKLHALDDGHVVEVEELELRLDELCIAEAGAAATSTHHHIATRRSQVQISAGPYSMVGQLHAPAAADSFLSIDRRSRMIPLTDATLRFLFRGRPMLREQSVMIFNRDLATSVRRLSGNTNGVPAPVRSDPVSYLV